MIFNAFNVEVVLPESMKKEEIPIIVSNDCIDVETNLPEKVISKKTSNKKAVKSVAITTKNNNKPKSDKEKATILKSNDATANATIVYKNNNISNSD